jgi:hypothetical protein
MIKRFSIHFLLYNQLIFFVNMAHTVLIFAKQVPSLFVKIPHKDFLHPPVYAVPHAAQPSACLSVHKYILNFALQRLAMALKS